MRFSKKEQDVRLGSPAARLLGCKWQPVCLVASISNHGAKLRLVVFDQPIVVIRLRSGRLVVVNEHCPHRGASLLYSFVDESSFSCPYHGWEFDFTGQCISQPFEEKTTKATCRATTYPCVEKYGLVFVWFGPPDEVPSEAPSFSNLDRQKVKFIAQEHAAVNCNWLELQENAADVTHTFYLHGRMNFEYNSQDSTGFANDLIEYGFLPKETCLIKTWRYRSQKDIELFGYGNLLYYPNMLVLETEVHWRIPVTNDTTKIFIVSCVPMDYDLSEVNYNITVRLPNGDYDFSSAYGQDAMALETSRLSKKQSLGRADYGIQIFRKKIRQLMKLDDLTLFSSKHFGSQVIEVADFFGGFIPSTSLYKPNSESTETLSWQTIASDAHVSFKVVRE